MSINIKNTMNYKTLKTGEKVSILGFGCMRLPLLDAKDATSIDYEKAQIMIDKAYAEGINYYDTAYPYHNGKSEVFIGEALKKYPRDSYYLANKMPSWKVTNLKEAEEVFNEQLERCQTEYFDFYLCHALNKKRFEEYENFLLDFLINKQKEGKIKRLGFSYHDSPENLVHIANYHAWDFVQLQINYLDWEYQRASVQYDIITKLDIPIMVMEPIRGGSLAVLSQAAEDILRELDSTKTIASWALKYVFDLENVVVTLSGMTELEHVDDNINTAKEFKGLATNEREAIEKALLEYRKALTIPCTSCRYCIVECPKGLDIARNFEIFNQYTLTVDVLRNYLFTKDRYQKLNNGIAAACIDCKKCIKQCPQAIDIPEELKRVARTFRD